jgi:hypothetical protein
MEPYAFYNEKLPPKVFGCGSTIPSTEEIK